MTVSDSSVRIVLLYPDLLGTYGDSGNATILAKRVALHDISAEVVLVHSDETVTAEGDIYLLGGGEDGPQNYARDLLSKEPNFARAIDKGALVFAVCAGFQILGDSYVDARGEIQSGLGVVDAKTRRIKGDRAVGELLGESLLPISQRLLSGFENHGSGTTLFGRSQPISRTLRGVGNDYDAHVDGALQGNVLCTYMHGPALARNYALADYLLEKAVGLKPLEGDWLTELQMKLLSERIESLS
ncbi:hypothetical protein SAMN02745225_01788 [Ferrithrix thermotolerans DSM 19514]|uniref:Lipid II isoglutaminyl synthase (glutamine-hydrolyzing) subunit GatD n=1 Tax=Ferrithrix thermotolerans DSM 19514 TaxID=1121881 RepID=A0A1M4WU14_9ACTN|nr:glutamine amidotransferase [Ferrithrix thermotolerans]SHE84736.1 hypothetical protein SAMN02745225_01788 [Ferrithrix thermotolerans DSM 19514]